jgi:hypothetical protein
MKNKNKCIKFFLSNGFYIFPLSANSKVPPKGFTDFENNSISALEDYKPEDYNGFNFGVLAGKHRDGALVLIDVDKSDKKDGMKVLKELQQEGCGLPKTLVQKTPSGGYHYFYRVDEPLKQGTNILGLGVDIRSKGGYVVGAGSKIDGVSYEIVSDAPVAELPDWVREKLGKSKPKREVTHAVEEDILQNIVAAEEFLKTATPSVEGAGGDATAFQVAARVRDFGVSETRCLELMVRFWNPNCQPPWDQDELAKKVENAYNYAVNDQGSATPQADFTAIEKPETTDAEPQRLTPIDRFNSEYAFVLLGGKSTVYLNKTDQFLSIQAFKDYVANERVFYDGKDVALSKVWLESKKRRTYTGTGMYPTGKEPLNTLNVYKGFAVKPLGEEEKATSEMIDGVEMLKEHIRDNICGGEDALFHWLYGYFAQLVQNPFDKPLTACVFRGEKGVGKNAFIERVGNLFDPAHFLLASNRRYLTGQFNSHLAKLVLFVLDEGFWSGDKAGEGVLKDLITGTNHVIERKGYEPYSVQNLTRVCMIGNDSWIVPASEDERRFAVFDVGNARQGDSKYFRAMRELIDFKGGNRFLLKDLLEYDVSDLDLAIAPKTKGLLNQKLESLEGPARWWYTSLTTGELDAYDGDGDFGDFVKTKDIYEAYIRSMRQQGQGRYAVNIRAFSKKIIAFNDNTIGAARATIDGERVRGLNLNSLDRSRDFFNKYLRAEVDYSEGEDDPFS